MQHAWRTASNCDGADRLEILHRPATGQVLIRNNQSPERFVTASIEEWQVLREAILKGEFNLL